ncbi:MAG TPA: DUF4129 domain-containing protein [Hellea balneolensis]|uniref:DUF4129 domain-containing protein n=1 Tax=Hellea balneolensis TaxID=287478 RepID=A0A7C5R4R2_9PROT|nr:DUF4129 domain-containing protein [Hellea balneolensis]
MWVDRFRTSVIAFALIWVGLCTPLTANTTPLALAQTAMVATALPDDLQQNFPQDKARAKPKPIKLGWLDALFKVIGPFMVYLFWGFIAAIVITLLYFIGREIMRARLRAFKRDKIEDEDEQIETYQPDAETARIVLEDADKLAALGRYDEAVHTLLFRSIQDIADKRPGVISRSLTSREISGLRILTPKAREGFSYIGTLVERSFFGDTRLGASDYERSKDAYKNFAYEKLAR